MSEEIFGEEFGASGSARVAARSPANDVLAAVKRACVVAVMQNTARPNSGQTNSVAYDEVVRVTQNIRAVAEDAARGANKSSGLQTARTTLMRGDEIGAVPAFVSEHKKVLIGGALAGLAYLYFRRK